MKSMSITKARKNIDDMKQMGYFNIEGYLYSWSGKELPITDYPESPITNTGIYNLVKSKINLYDGYYKSCKIFNINPIIKEDFINKEKLAINAVNILMDKMGIKDNNKHEFEKLVRGLESQGERESNAK